MQPGFYYFCEQRAKVRLLDLGDCREVRLYNISYSFLFSISGFVA